MIDGMDIFFQEKHRTESKILIRRSPWEKKYGAIFGWRFG